MPNKPLLPSRALLGSFCNFALSRCSLTRLSNLSATYDECQPRETRVSFLFLVDRLGKEEIAWISDEKKNSCLRVQAFVSSLARPGASLLEGSHERMQRFLNDRDLPRDGYRFLEETVTREPRVSKAWISTEEVKKDSLDRRIRREAQSGIERSSYQ